MKSKHSVQIGKSVLLKACVIAVFMSALPAAARELVWVGSEDASLAVPGNWKLRDTWENSTSCPTNDDLIVISRWPMRLDATDAESMAVFNGCTAVLFALEASVCRIEVSDGDDASIDVPMLGGFGPVDGNASYGSLTISGPGTVRLNATGMKSYLLRNFVAENGASVYLPQNGDLSNAAAYELGTVVVSNSATLHLPVRHDGLKNGGSNYVIFNGGLFGDGTLDAAENTELRSAGAAGDFAGVITSKVRLYIGGVQDFTGEESSLSFSIPRAYGGRGKWSTGSGIIGVKKFGIAGGNSSIGTASAFETGAHGGTYRYLGGGEETDKDFRPYAAATGGSYLDGGAGGGLVFSGDAGIDLIQGAAANNAIVGLNGSNALPCVISGKIREKDDSFLLTLVKKGTGTWRLADPADGGNDRLVSRNFRGAISVDEGVLQFDSAAPAGEYCSIGLATMPKVPELGAWASLADAGCAISLGGLDSSLENLAEGTLEYTGSSAALCDQRRIRLEADGRLRANGAKHVRYRMAPPTSARAKTLSLDGSSTATNEVHDIVDSPSYPVSVVKEGAGTWLLGGDLSFHGDLTVKGGRLIVREYDAGDKYTWFRFTVKNQFEPVTSRTNRNTSIYFFGLFDENGYCHTLNTRQSEDSFAASVMPGEAGYGTTRLRKRGSYTDNNPVNNDNLTNLFSRATVYDASFTNVSATAEGYPRIADPLTWVPIVVRLTNGAPAIASYDWVNVYGWNTGSKAGFQWTPNIWSLEGSVDGMHWENVKIDGGDFSINTNDCAALANTYQFIYSGVNYNRVSESGMSSPVRHDGGCAIRGISTNSYSVLTGVRSVRVDSGATLVLDGVSEPLDNLVVDAQIGGGMIDGGSFASSGCVNVLNFGRGEQSIPMDMSSVSGASNLSKWTVAADGEPRDGWKVKYREGYLKLVPSGLTVVIR